MVTLWRRSVAQLLFFGLVMFMVLFLLNFVPRTIAPQSEPAGDVASRLARDFYDAAPKPECPDRQWSIEELRNHATEKDLLVLVHGWVLNVTEFLPHHPGGRAILTGAGGVDAAEAFTEFHQSSTTALFSNFCVGHARAPNAKPRH